MVGFDDLYVENQQIIRFATKSTKEWLVQLVTEPNKLWCVRKKGLNIHNKFCPHKMALMSLRCKLINFANLTIWMHIYAQIMGLD